MSGTRAIWGDYPFAEPNRNRCRLICSALNQNIGAYTVGPAAVDMERRTVRWLTDLVGYDESAGGNLTSGGMMANFIGLKLARDSVSGDRIQHEGVQQRWAVYTSDQRHVSVDKAVDAVGLGRESLRALPTDSEFRVRLDALETAIAEDHQRGVRPMCIVGMFGTTNTGSVDPVRELRNIADREGMWLHVDAAYGGGMCSPMLAYGQSRLGACGFGHHRSPQVVLRAARCGRDPGQR